MEYSSAIILAGGIGSRMKNAVPKQFIALAGRPMILHTLERLEKLEQIGEVVVVCYPKYQEFLRMNIEAYMLRKKYVIVDSGESRQESVRLGLQAAAYEQVMLHEAARPFVTVEDFSRLLEFPAENATYGTEIPFTVLIQTDGMISGLLERDRLLNIQLPQKFNRELLLQAHEKARAEGRTFTEDASLLYQYTHCPIHVLPGASSNIKITDSIDLLTGELIYKDCIVGRE